MIKFACGVLATAAVAGFGLAPAAASAATTGQPALAYSSTIPGGGDPDTTVTFTVTSGLLTMTAPVSVNIGSGAPGTTIAGALGAVTVTDDRALLTASWTADASATDWTTGAGTPAETIPAGDVGYDPGTVTTTGTVTVTGTPITLSATVAPDVTASTGVGDDTASWDPTLSVAVPAAAVGGAYTGTVTDAFA
jgi:hypothetical protein